jgi:hypothetical protein
MLNPSSYGRKYTGSGAPLLLSTAAERPPHANIIARIYECRFRSASFGVRSEGTGRIRVTQLKLSVCQRYSQYHARDIQPRIATLLLGLR